MTKAQDTKSEKYILIGYSSEKKAYKCFNPSTRGIQVSHDVEFEEELNANSNDDIRPSPLPKDKPSSTELSGPHEPSRDESMSRPRPKSYEGKGKMPEYEVDHPDDSDSDVSARSLDSEFGVPIMRTPGVR